MKTHALSAFAACAFLLLPGCSGGDDGGAGGPGTTSAGAGGATTTGPGTGGAGGQGGSHAGGGGGATTTGAGGAGGQGGALPAACGSEAAVGAGVVSVAPADGDERVLRALSFAVTLDAALGCDATLAAKPTLTAHGAGSAVPLTAPTCTAGPTTLRFAPAVELAHATEHTLVVDGLVDAEGAALAPCSVTFRTKSRAVDVEAGTRALAAIDEDGTLWTWADGFSAAFDGRAAPSVPAAAPLGGRAVSVAAGWDFVVAALEDGGVWAWGGNTRGELGDGTKAKSGGTPVKVALPAGVRVVKVASSPNHTVALADDGSVYAWGANDAGEVGDGTNDDAPSPRLVAGVVGAVDVSAGRGSPVGGHSYALLADGTVAAWGANVNGTLGVLPEGGEKLAPVTVSGISGATRVSAGDAHGYVVTAAGEGLAWGRAGLGGLGDGTCQLPTPTLAAPISGPGGAGTLGDLVAIDGGHLFAMALREDGTVWGWGDDLQGVLGDGTTGGPATCVGGSFDVTHSRLVPVQATGVAGAIDVSAGATASLVVLADGDVLAAGDDTNLALGVPGAGPGGVVSTFTKVPGL